MENLKSGFNATSQTHPEFESDDILNINSDDISFIRFEGVQVRIVKVNNEPWFIAKDVCNALELTNSRVALLALDSDEKNTVSLTYGIKGNPKRSIVSESGFYKLIARSRKATTKGTFAHRFTNWVFRDVIPSTRINQTAENVFAFDYNEAQASRFDIRAGYSYALLAKNAGKVHAKVLSEDVTINPATNKINVLNSMKTRLH